MHRITDFTEIKAYVDVFNEHGHKGFREPINPFFWWNYKWLGKVDDKVNAFYDDGLVVILELEEKTTVKNLLVFALCPQKNILKRILTITKDYDSVTYNSEYHDRYRNITRRIDGSSSFTNGRFYYAANGKNAWDRLAKQ